MAGGTDRCPVCDGNILMPFRKRTQGDVEVVVVCANQRCNATFRMVSPGSMQLVACEEADALTRYPTAMTLAQWYEVWKETHARRNKTV
jgi:hypothetical protein